jgi:hypothetical protein
MPGRQNRSCRALSGSLVLTSTVVLAAGCSSSSSPPKAPTIGAARTFHLAGFEPTAPVSSRKPVDVTFRIDQPSGSPLVDYRTGSGPHTGVHVIVVRDDLSVIIHRHPKIGPGGTVRQRFVLPEPGPYRVLVDAYPNLNGPQRNFQLLANIRASGSYKPRPVAPTKGVQTVDGYRISLGGASHLRAIQPAFVKATILDPSGKPATFQPWYGALAHAIFFRARTLDYFHTHVCGAATLGCTSTLGGSSVMGRSTMPGRLEVGILLPLPGTWRLFLQFRTKGHVVTAPFTLRVR